ncbi:hypothetical protein ACLOAV_006892 [Pseudogymnoascus australis]
MKAYRQGQDTSSLLKLLSHKEIVTKTGFAQLTTSEARIIDDTLLVRDQTVFMVPSPQFAPASLSGTFGYCRHSILNMADRISDLEWVGYTVPEAGEMEYVDKGGLTWCNRCHTQLKISFKSCGKDYNAMFVTRWMDVGKGRDENDPKWRSRWDNSRQDNDWGRSNLVYELGSLSAMFEGTYNFQFDSLLTKEDETELCAKCPVEGAGEGNESSPFRLLPSELILMIASYLPPESAGILALSCTPLYSCLQTDYLEPLEDGESPAIYSFLDLLAQDLQTYIACPHCSKLHSTLFYKDHAGSNLYYQTWRPSRKPLLECRTADISSNLSLRIQPNFSSTLFRMVMKIYRQGQDTTEFLQQLSFRGFEKHGTWSAEKRIASARIISGSLLTREQRVFMVSASQKFPVPCGDGACFYICAHFPNFTLQSLLKQGIQIPRSDFVEAYRNEQGILCCDFCYTEFRIDFKSYGKAGNAMFVTRWMDIGEGRDVNDPKWKKKTCARGDIVLDKGFVSARIYCCGFRADARV